MDVNITGEDAVLGPPVAMRFLIAAIVTMRQKIISTLSRSTDTIFPAIKLNRLYVHFVRPNKRFSKTVLTVVFVWASTSVGRVSSLMMMYLRSNIIAVAVEFAGMKTGGCENVFHCYKCGCCYPTQMKNSHPCVEGAMHHDCPVCFEYLFESVNDVLVLPCGHTIHKSCLNEMREHFQYACPLCSKSVCDMSMIWEKFDMEIAATPMPEAYRNKMIWILCNDCTKTSHVQYHLVAQKCLNCKSYNTRQIRG
ncbi:probable E3 ubiquitin-protein ligase RZFP34 isoform X2 [Vigna umbellata]|uniref:probable E3 ubiquitin-protein ligase RZFP34 isoform X2 n=1 Tax=Vigna umbellata TaxID=87088 RepID=UPI001F5FAFAD|nr:probable E3 ubiquitin-protein ligase RZFP34 isoform X2 [Vigna umbellata]